MKRLKFLLAASLAVAALQPASAAQPPLDYIYGADTLVERTDEYACQLAISGQIAADEGFLLSSDTYVGKAGGYGVVLALRLHRQRDGRVADVPLAGLRIDAAGISTTGFSPYELPLPGGIGLVNRDDRSIFRAWGPALIGTPFTLTIERADGRGAVSVTMPPLPDDLAERHLNCLERLGG